MSIAFLFPGQGSQTPASGLEWQDTAQWSLVEVASQASGRDVAHLLLVAEAEELRDTANAQLSTYVVSMMIAAALRDGDLSPTHVGGHSLGEYSALTAAGVVSPGDGARLVAARGEAMRSAAAHNPGTMAAIIGLDVGEVASVCTEVGSDVWVANDNAPGQVVIAGTHGAVDAAGALAKERGARRPMALQVAGAFHTPLMAPAQDALDVALAETPFHSPALLPWANVDASGHQEPNDWPGLLSAQLCSPVRWREEISAMAVAGADVFVEVGPGNVLSGMVKRIVPDAARHAVATPAAVAELLQNLR